VPVNSMKYLWGFGCIQAFAWRSVDAEKRRCGEVLCIYYSSLQAFCQSCVSRRLVADILSIEYHGKMDFSSLAAHYNWQHSTNRCVAVRMVE